MARGKYKGPKRGSGQRNRDRTEEEEEEIFRRQGAGQGNTAGMMPPSDSDDSDEEEVPKEPVGMLAGMGAPGDLPPNSSDEEDDDEDSDSDDSDIQPLGMGKGKEAAPEPPRRKKKDEDEVDPAQIAKDMERLRLIREKREEQRLQRIKEEGWDRYAPVTATNKPPDARPSDHPDFKK